MEKMAPYFDNGKAQLYHGDALRLLREMESESVDAVITDPPYCSGGMSSAARTQQTTRDKYQQSGTLRRYPEFEGDNRDGHSWLAWCSLWISECHRLLKPGGFFAMFTDWRMFPSAADAIQCGGLVWRGVVTWDKTPAARPSLPGYFRHQCEYILWGTKGATQAKTGALPGCFTIMVKALEKRHITEKPLELMTQLLQPVPEGGVILDPFMGSATTGEAALLAGMSFIGCEMTEAYCTIARQRLEMLLPMTA